jgi:hypothetical protein
MTTFEVRHDSTPADQIYYLPPKSMLEMLHGSPTMTADSQELVSNHSGPMALGTTLHN